MPHVNKGLVRILSYIGVAPKDYNSFNYVTSTLTNLTLDSRLTNQHSVFLAISGNKTSGHLFLEQAANNGCQFALIETKLIGENGHFSLKQITAASAVLCIYVYALSQKLADIAYRFYDDNSEISHAPKLPTITAVTGTNGKTSVASILAQISSLCGQQSASIGTLGVYGFKKGLQSKLADTINTTPDIISLISTLSDLQKQGCKHVALEASSHGLEQDRLNKLKVNCAVFTNLTQDHLDYHQTMDAYSKAKRKLLDARGITTVVLNADDAESLNWQADTSNKQSIFWYSLRPLDKKYMGCWASDITFSTQGMHFTLHAKFPAYTQSANIGAKLIGSFNVSNLLASITALLAQNYPFSDVVAAISSVKSVAGRMELFKSAKASLLVDYAHTPDALKQALIAARVHTKGQLSCVFGCGGDRDTSKRAIMGEVATQYADHIVLTQDNSRSEDPLAIIADIKKGMGSLSSLQTLHLELDREQAILHAWQNSQKSDMIVVAGKGHEDYIEINNSRVAYNEREVVSALASRSLASGQSSLATGDDL